MAKRDVTVRIKETYVRTIVIKDVEDSVPDDTLQYEAYRLYTNNDKNLSEPCFDQLENLDTWDVWRGAPLEESETV